MLGGKFPLAALVTILGTILAVVVALTSRPNTPPKYHKVRTTLHCWVQLAILQS